MILPPHPSHIVPGMVCVTNTIWQKGWHVNSNIKFKDLSSFLLDHLLWEKQATMLSSPMDRPIGEELGLPVTT